MALPSSMALSLLVTRIRPSAMLESKAVISLFPFFEGKFLFSAFHYIPGSCLFSSSYTPFLIFFVDLKIIVPGVPNQLVCSLLSTVGKISHLPLFDVEPVG